jgi:predicted transcriptional regulator
LLEAHFKIYLADAAAMPLAVFAAAAKACGYDPVALAAQFGVDMAAVLRRLASLPAGADHPPMGLAVADASGALLLLKTVDGFAMQRTGAGCPLWPIYAAFARQGQPLRVEAMMPGANGQRFLCYAVATQAGAARFDAPQVLRATMLVMSDPPEGTMQKVEVGVACRICPRGDCAARREPSAIM